MGTGEYEPTRPHRSAESNLRDYLDAKINGNRELSDSMFKAQETAVNAALTAAEKAVNAALAASEKAIGKAEAAQLRVNEGQNEFRGTLKDQAAMLMPRAETELLLRELRGVVSNLNVEMSNLRSRIDVGPPSLSILQSRSDEQVGAMKTSAADWAKLIAAAGLLLAAAAFAFNVIRV